MLRDVYKFYKHSSKRKKGLEATNVRQSKVLNEFVDTMIREVQNGKKDLKVRPSLRLQYWNATRWLGRSECLNSLCRAYEHILEHLSEFAKAKGESAKDRHIGADLYERLTSYDTFLFIFLYRDLAATMAKTSRLLQLKDIRIHDVERRILSLCGKLKTNYSETSHVPTVLLDDSKTDDVMSELFGEDMNGKFPIGHNCSTNIPDILALEEGLQSQQPPEIQVVSDIPSGRATRGLNLSSKYMSLLLRNRREELVRETNEETETVELELEVVVSCIFMLIPVRTDLEKTHNKGERQLL